MIIISSHFDNPRSPHEKSTNGNGWESTFNVGDIVIKHMRMEYEKCCEPFEIVRKVNENAYVLAIPPNLGIPTIVNIEDLQSMRSLFL